MRAAAACWTAAAAILLSTILTGEHAMCLELLLPDNHTALMGDLQVGLIGPRPEHSHLQLQRATTDRSFVVIAAITVANSTSTVRFPCGVVTLGGRYRIVLFSAEAHTKEEASQEMDVLWPSTRLFLQPQHAQTYPEVPVIATVEFLPTTCVAAAGAVIPELWLELLFCGHSSAGCADSNTQVIFSQQLLGYPRRRDLVLKCELFGLAGHYVLTLRSKMYTPVPIVESEPAHMKVAVSDKFVFNVHARSILPCESLDGGVAVLFQYPVCEPRVDRVRLFAKLRADVASLAPPTSLHYVAEQRVPAGAHSLRFSCDLFSERYVEYCFVYVTQAVTGAVTDVRMDCVPTLPVQESDTGGWGAWSPWTHCTSSCGGGTRSRFRLCDSPPPRYGARFCEGPSLQSQHCGDGTEPWACDTLPVNHPGVVAEVGPGCRCGCVIHLGAAKQRRILATSTASCPGRTFWLIQADAGSVIRLTVVHLRLPCGRQWLKVRDGDSLAATLVASLSGRMTSYSLAASTSNYMLLDFFSGDVLPACLGSFLVRAEQTAPPPTNITLSVEEDASPLLSVVHMLAASFVTIVLLVSALLAAQSLFRYQKYQLAMSQDSELGSAPSRSTLLSEVMSIKKLLPGSTTVHTRLCDDNSEPEYEVVGDCSTTDHHQEQQFTVDQPSDVAPPLASTPCTPRDSPASLRRSITFSPDKETQKTPTPQTPQSHSAMKGDLRRPLEKGRQRSKGQHVCSTPSRAVSWSSVATLSNGWCSPNNRQKNSVKEQKEKRNLERLLASGCSELSLAAGDTDLELDYYDYNVSNAGAVPGSFLGMDPQYLVWIPPFAPGRWEADGELLEMAARSRHQSGSDSDELTEFISKAQNGRWQNQPLSDMDDVTECDQQKVNNRYTKPVARLHHQRSETEETTEFIPLICRGQDSDRKELVGNNSYSDKVVDLTVRSQHHPEEKETRMEKSAYDDDIKFVDEEDDDDDDDNRKLEPGNIILADNKQQHRKVMSE